MTTSVSAVDDWRRELSSILRFGAVGLLTTAIDVGLFSVLTRLSLPILPSNLASYSCGIATSYALNRRFTFKAGHNWVQAVRFTCAMLAGLCLSTCLVWLLSLFLQAIVAKLVSVPVIFSWNFLTARLWVFRKNSAVSTPWSGAERSPPGRL
jgi:putative flippase GtrA